MRKRGSQRLRTGSVYIMVSWDLQLGLVIFIPALPPSRLLLACMMEEE